MLVEQYLARNQWLTNQSQIYTAIHEIPLQGQENKEENHRDNLQYAEQSYTKTRLHVFFIEM